MGNRGAELTATYDDLADWVLEAYTLRRRLLEGAADDMRESMIADVPRVPRRLLRAYARLMTPVLLAFVHSTGVMDDTLKLGEYDKEVFLRVATGDEQEQRAFQHVVSEYWAEDLAASFVQVEQPSPAQIRGLRQIHESRSGLSGWERLTSGQRIALTASAAVGVVAALLPKDVFEVAAGGGHAYDVFRLVLAFIVVAAGLLVGSLALVGKQRGGFLERRRTRRKASQALAVVIGYCEYYSEVDSIMAARVSEPG